jgi:hypothetical protein
MPNSSTMYWSCLADGGPSHGRMPKTARLQQLRMGHTLQSLSGDGFSPQTGTHGLIGSLSSCRMVLPTSRDREFLRSHSGRYP